MRETGLADRSILGTPSPWFREVAPAAPWILGAVALIAVAAFDLAPPLAYNDDWVMAWSVRHLISAHSLAPFPAQSALALVQTVWAALATLGHPDLRWLRLSVLPFAALGAISTYRIARSLGANTVWSGIAGVTLLASPMYLTLATSFMTDVPSVGLLMAAAAAGLVWIERREWIGGTALLAALAVLQRQTNLVFPFALAATMLLARGERPIRRRDLRGLALLFVACILAIVLPATAGIAPATQANWLAGVIDLDGTRLAPLTSFGSVLGLVALPFAAAMLYQPKPITSPQRFAWLAAAGLGVAGLVMSLLRWLDTGSIFPGNVLTPVGFTPILKGVKPAAFPPLAFAALSILVLATFSILLIYRRRMWSVDGMPIGQRFILLSAVGQFVVLFLVHLTIFDRYFLPAIASLIPLFAVWASASLRPRLAVGFAMSAMLGGLGLYLVGQQDYASWQQARDLAAKQAYRLVPPDLVNAGYEANGAYVVLPTYQRAGVMLETLAAPGRPAGFAALGPHHPRIVLLFSRPDDPRPGVSYRSLAPGRIVLEEVAP